MMAAAQVPERLDGRKRERAGDIRNWRDGDRRSRRERKAPLIETTFRATHMLATKMRDDMIDAGRPGIAGEAAPQPVRLTVWGARKGRVDAMRRLRRAAHQGGPLARLNGTGADGRESNPRLEPGRPALCH